MLYKKKNIRFSVAMGQNVEYSMYKRLLNAQQNIDKMKFIAVVIFVRQISDFSFESFQARKSER